VGAQNPGILSGVFHEINCCYILFSEKLNQHYVGACHDNLISRIAKHNSRAYGNHRFTAKSDDWKLIKTIDCDSFSQARSIELHIKRMKSSTYIKNIIAYPEMILKLKEKYSG
jgi:putative endonuclease